MVQKTAEKEQKLPHIDEIDRKILNILQQNGREKLTSMAKKVGLSVNPVKSRIAALEKSGVIERYMAQIAVEKLGLRLGLHVYLKLTNVSRERFEEMVTYLKGHIRVINLISMHGDYDVYLTIIAKDNIELDDVKMEIREKFKDLIGEWKEVMVSNIYKLEEYRV